MTIRNFSLTVFIILLINIASASCDAGFGNDQPARPNIIIILVDDMGYGDLGCYGNEIISTPNIDSLAETGMRFTDFYSSGSWGLPARLGLLTGVHPNRPGLSRKVLAERVTIAEMLKQIGYKTAAFGKWQLGVEFNLRPLDQGFNYFLGTAVSNDIPPPEGKRQVYEVYKNSKEEDWPVPLVEDRKPIELPAKQSNFTRRYTEESIKFIKENKDTSFFLYLAHNMPHVPIYPSGEFKGKSKGGIYGDVIEELDWSVGQIVKTLKNEGIDDNTLVIFMSDNGPWSMFKELGGSAGPLRGEKGTCWEGGIRVPAIFSWPGKIEPGVSHEFMTGLDIYATLAAITTGLLPNNYELDSKDMSGVLLNGEESPRTSFLLFPGPPWKVPFSYRSGNYKIHFRTIDLLYDPLTGRHIAEKSHDPPLLFDLSKDMGESKNIAADKPGVLERMIKEYDQAAKEIATMR